MNSYFEGKFILTLLDVFQQLLLARGADLEIVSRRGNTAMLLAQSRGHDSIFRLLRDLGDVNAVLPQGWNLKHRRKRFSKYSSFHKPSWFYLCPILTPMCFLTYFFIFTCRSRYVGLCSTTQLAPELSHKHRI